MEVVVPCQAMISLIEPHYPKTSSKGGQPPYPLVTMLRVYLRQQWYSLSDPAPDEITILSFRHLLEKNNLGEAIFETLKDHLSERGMTMRQGTVMDATLIAAPSSTKNKTGQRDPEEMH